MQKPLGITMGCPAGIGPEIILKYCDNFPTLMNTAVVIGDISILSKAQEILKTTIPFNSFNPEEQLKPDHLNILPVSDFANITHQFGLADKQCGLASGKYIETGVELIQNNKLAGLVTCPISKAALNSAGYNFPGHTELLAKLTNTKNVVMMMAGDSLCVTLATVHCALSEVTQQLTVTTIAKLIETTNKSLQIDFGIQQPVLGVAGLNPHAGEDKLFGDEEITIIEPAIKLATNQGIKAYGPFPPDTIFYKAAKGQYDAVICMYHDQGLIPFKLLHFEDGVNVTLGLPIVRTSVDHGAAYDIAGTTIANFNSLRAATELAQNIILNRQKFNN